MRKLFIGLLVLSLHCGFSFIAVLGQDSDLRPQNPLRVIVVEGSPFERGVQHGKALKEEIHELIREWKSDLEQTYKMEAAGFIGKFLDETRYQEAIKKYTPDLWEELKGMAKGADVDFDTLYAFQLVDEFWCLGRDVAANHCTTFGAGKTDTQPSFTAQTLDIPMFHGYQTLLHVKDPETKLEAFVLSFPGFIGANGMNNAPVSVCVNAVQQLAASRDGLPVAFVVRGVLEKKSYEEAVRFLKEIKFGAPQNYLIGGIDDVASFECSERQVDAFVPFSGARFTYHTNHPLINTNLSPDFMSYLKTMDKTPGSFEFSCPRLQCLKDNYADNSATLDLKELKKIFSHRESNINNRSTFSCTIMVLSDKPELHITAGRPDEAVFQEFTFN
ncbi:MAG: C45 family peptidase [Planctomycetota bacterium]